MENREQLILKPTFQEIYDMEKVGGIIEYKDKCYPCICKWDYNHIIIDVKTYFTLEHEKEISMGYKEIKINDTIFYISEIKVDEIKEGKKTILNVKLVSKEILEELVNIHLFN